jgi:hypothetical protein
VRTKSLPATGALHAVRFCQSGPRRTALFPWVACPPPAPANRKSREAGPVAARPWLPNVGALAATSLVKAKRG